ncbi:MAG: hypothetical protein PHH16_04580 [Candidatus Gracilibacteria bacterium]|nr:hypothetical protein [Candidatus Gracilibacteria bacterium]
MNFPKFSSQSLVNGIVFGFSVFFTVSILSVGYAAWNGSMSKVGSGSGLTANGWNAIVDNINDLNTRLSSLPAESDPSVNALGKASLSCSSGQVAKWNGSAWACAADAGITAESDPSVNALGKASLSCSSGQVAKWNGSAWACAAESDPKVGTLTNGMWCTTNGSTVNCTSSAPSVPSGTLCGWSNGTSLIATKFLCQGVNPASSCPAGYVQSSFTDGGSSLWYICIKS